MPTKKRITKTRRKRKILARRLPQRHRHLMQERVRRLPLKMEALVAHIHLSTSDMDIM
jgi:hypothetical protein